MPTLDIGEQIKDWTSSRLVRFIKDLFEKDPPAFIGSTSIDNLEVVNNLLVKDRILFTRDPNLHFVGNPGEASFTNSWVNWGAPYNPASYWKDPLGWVRVGGVVKSGTVNTLITTLPPGYAPAFTVVVPVISNGAIGRLEIDTSGGIKLVSGSNVYVSLDNITYKAA